MFNLAGRYASKIGRDPLASAAAGGLGAAGLATLGNVAAEQTEEKGPGRLGLEAAGAGALGALLGANMPGIRSQASRLYRNIGNVNLENPGAVSRKAKMTPQEIQQAEFVSKFLNGTVRAGVDPSQARKDVKATLGRTQAAINTVGLPTYLLGAGAVGGLAGGGVSNIAGMFGIPGLEQNQQVDPESYGSSNTQMARTSTPTLRYLG